MKFKLMLAVFLNLHAVINPNNCCLQQQASYPLPSGSSYPWDLVFSPDGSHLATVNFNSYDVTVFAVSNGVLSGGTSYKFPVSTYGSTSLAYSPDGSYLVTANVQSNDATLFSVNPNGTLNTGISYLMGESGGNSPSSVAISPDSTHVAFGELNPYGGYYFVRVYNGSASGLSGSASFGMYATQGSPWSLAYSPDGSNLATGNQDGNIAIFKVDGDTLTDLSTYSVLTGGTSPDNPGIAYSYDGLMFAFASAKVDGSGTPIANNIYMFNVTNGDLGGMTVNPLPSSSTGPNSVAFSPNNACLTTTSTASNDVIIFEVYANGTLSSGTSYPLSAGSYASAFSPDNLYVAVTGYQSNDVTVFAVVPCPTPTPMPTSTATTSLSTSATSSVTSGSTAGSSTSGTTGSYKTATTSTTTGSSTSTAHVTTSVTATSTTTGTSHPSDASQLRRTYVLSLLVGLLGLHALAQ